MERILVRRTGAFGDVIDTTPVIRRLRQENPDAEIDILTQYPGVFKDSPRRVGVFKQDTRYDRFIDLDMAFERNLRRVGVVESYMEVAFGDREGSTQLEMAYGPPPQFGLDWSLAITMHPARSWVHRTLPERFWIDLANILAKRGWIVLCIGTRQDWGFSGHRVLDLRDRFDVQTQAAVIGASRVFVCSGSGPMMLAQVTDVPIVTMNTMSMPWIHQRDRHGIKGWRMYDLMAPIDCVGCSHRFNEPVTYFDCPRGDNICVTLFDPLMVADKVEEAARETAPC